jgi:hypothetical protein
LTTVPLKLRLSEWVVVVLVIVTNPLTGRGGPAAKVQIGVPPQLVSDEQTVFVWVHLWMLRSQV